MDRSVESGMLGRGAALLLAVAPALLGGCAGDKVNGEERRAVPDRLQEREHMVARQLAGRDIVDARVLAAMRTIPRHRFVPADVSAGAYGDHPLPIGARQTISQPYVVAWMTQALELQPGERVLEIGTGSGYQAAVLAELTPEVYTIEIVRELGERAARTLRELGYESVRARIGDGYAGWPEAAPFDAIMVTAAPGFVPPTLLEQLAVGGRMVLPVGEEHQTQELLRLVKQPDGSVKTERLGAVRFVPMTGAVREQQDAR